MSDEAKAGLLWKCPYDAAFHFGLAHDCEAQIGENDCGDFIGKCEDPEPYLCIPADEAREFLEAVEGIAEHTKIWELRDKARALLATLPEKAAAVIAVAEEE